MLEDDDDDRLSVDYDDMVSSNGYRLDAPVAALSKRRRFMMVFYAGLITMLTSGVVLVMPPLIDVLIDDGVYHEKCVHADSQCAAQRDAFNAAVVFAVNAFNLVSFPSGVLLDRCGPRLSLMLGAVIFAMGALLVANVSGTNESTLFIADNTVLIGFTLLGSAGPLLFQPFLHLANLFPSHSGTITTMLVSMLEGSCVVFAIMNVLHFSSLEMGHRILFIGYTAVPLIVLLTAFIWPTTAYKKAQKVVDHHYLAMHAEEEEEEEGKDIDPFVAQKNLSFSKQLLSMPYFCFWLFMVLGLYRTNFYTNFVIDSQIGDHGEKGDSDNAFYRTAFAWVMPMGGILSVPFVGKCLDYFSVKTNLALLAILGVLMDGAILQGNPPFEGKQLFLFAYTLTSIFRAALFSVNCTYLTHVFGWKNYGSLLGFSTFSTGLIGFTMSALIDLVDQGPDYSMFVMNCVWLGVSVLRVGIPVWFHFYDESKRVEFSVYGINTSFLANENASLNKSFL